MMWAPLFWTMFEAVNMFRRDGDNIYSRQRFAISCAFCAFYLVPYNIVWPYVARSYEVVIQPWTGGYVHSEMTDIMDLYNGEKTEDDLVGRNLPWKNYEGEGEMPAELLDAQMMLLDEAYSQYKWEVWWDLPWYTMRNIVFAIGAYKYHAEMLE